MERKRLKPKLASRHSKKVENVLFTISDLDKTEQKAVIFELVRYLALEGRTYEKTYAKLLLSALEYCDPRLRRFRDELRSDGHVVMHRVGAEGRWMREATSEGHGRLRHVKEEDAEAILGRRRARRDRFAKLRRKLPSNRNGRPRPGEELSV